jgi:dTDP-glucose 4,6-dehydratase
VHTDLPTDDPRVRCPDTTLARELLGWQPEVAVDEGLKRTLEWFAAEVLRDER